MQADYLEEGVLKDVLLGMCTIFACFLILFFICDWITRKLKQFHDQQLETKQHIERLLQTIKELEAKTQRIDLTAEQLGGISRQLQGIESSITGNAHALVPPPPPPPPPPPLLQPQERDPLEALKKAKKNTIKSKENHTKVSPLMTDVLCELGKVKRKVMLRAAYLNNKNNYIKSPLGQHQDKLQSKQTNLNTTLDKLKSGLFMNTEKIKRELTQVQLKKTNLPRSPGGTTLIPVRRTKTQVTWADHIESRLREKFTAKTNGLDSSDEEFV